MAEYLIQYGAVIGYVAVGLVALIALGLVQLLRRRRDLKRARVAVRLVTYSICDPRQGPVAITGTYHESKGERWIACRAQRVLLEGEVDVARGTGARWRGGKRTYTLRNDDTVIAIGVMSRVEGTTWRLVASPEEKGVQLYAATPRPAPAPLWPWRAPLVLAITGGLAFFGLSKVGEALLDATCADRLRLEIAAAMPLVRDDALAKLRKCAP